MAPQGGVTLLAALGARAVLLSISVAVVVPKNFKCALPVICRQVHFCISGAFRTGQSSRRRGSAQCGPPGTAPKEI